MRIRLSRGDGFAFGVQADHEAKHWFGDVASEKSVKARATGA